MSSQTAVGITPGYCAWHGHHGMTACPKCSTAVGTPIPPPLLEPPLLWTPDTRPVLTYRCVKCGHEDIGVAWHGKGCEKPGCSCSPHCGYNAASKDHEEHLHYACRTCQFDWTGPLTPEPPRIEVPA